MDDRNTESRFGSLSEDAAPGRRRLLKLLAAGGAGAAAAALLPGSWKRPLATIGTLPAHAQSSAFSGDLQVVMSWTASAPVDFELHVVEPDLTDVFGPTSGPTLGHSGNAPLAVTGNEVVQNTTPGVVAAGTYQIYIRCVSSLGGLLSFPVAITPNGGPTTNVNMLPPFSSGCADLCVAKVTFPGGAVDTSGTGSTYP